MTDETLDRELAELLAVDPSPAFLARVRERVGGEEMGQPWWRLTWVPATVAAFALLLFIGLGLETSTVAPATVSAPASASTTPAPELPEVVMIPSVSLARVSQGRGVGRRTKRPPTVVDPFDDIQLSAAEQNVLRGLRASWHGVPMPDMTPVPRDTDERPVALSAIAVGDVTVARVVIEPTALMARRQE
jgi:hypothetical protein